MTGASEARERPSVDEVRALFNYDPETGALTWRVSRTSATKPGLRAGWGDRPRVSIGRRARYMVTHIIWVIVYGCWPSKVIDHIDGNPLNNRLANLREATLSQNSMNQRPPRNLHGMRGVQWSHGKYAAKIKVRRKVIWLGTFETAEEAGAAFQAAAKKYHGEFAHPSSVGE